jgi:hypothetical protein
LLLRVSPAQEQTLALCRLLPLLPAAALHHHAHRMPALLAALLTHPGPCHQSHHRVTTAVHLMCPRSPRKGNYPSPGPWKWLVTSRHQPHLPLLLLLLLLLLQGQEAQLWQVALLLQLPVLTAMACPVQLRPPSQTCGLGQQTCAPQC